jgi:predicted house-cleaning noncanonical NTP pyrophosphatase (MazG superfamily)
MCAPAKKQFLHDELFSLTLMAMVQRGKIYKATATNKERNQFHKELQRSLKEIAAEYRTDKTDEEHEKNISRLADTLSFSQHAVLREERFRIGSAQKALNLFLKYLWCLEEILPPPHCPFDAGIIRQLELPPAVPRNWTELV